MKTKTANINKIRMDIQNRNITDYTS